MARRELVEAYERTFGRITHGGKERDRTNEIPGALSVNISDREIARFAQHGIANIRIPAGNFAQTAFIIDIQKLRGICDIKTAWLNQAPGILTVHISNGTQIPKERAIPIDTEHKLEGLLITTISLGRTPSAHYYTRVTQLYGKNSL